MDWSARYAAADTPWDCAGPHPELVARLPELALSAGARVLVPGCGRGHDALFLARAGANVTAIDIVDLLAERLGPALAELGGRFIVGDALAFAAEEGFDLLFEHTFFCAIAPDQRPAWGEMVRRVLRPEGRVAALVFPVDRPAELGGPPWTTTTADLQRALGAGFRSSVDEPAGRRVERREWRERWAVFQRVGGGS